MCRRSISLCLLSWLVLSLIPHLQAADHILTIGGGPHAGSNQLSLENNVRYFQRVLSRLQIPDLQQKILFSDGGDPQRDLQFEGERNPEDLRSLLAEIIGPATGSKFDYRSSLLPIVDGTAEPSTIEETLKQYGVQLVNGDRFIVYFTGHGGRARGSVPAGGPNGAFRGRRGFGDQRGPGEGREFEQGESTIDGRDLEQDRNRVEEPEPTPTPTRTEQDGQENLSKVAEENGSPDGERSESEERRNRFSEGGPRGRGPRREEFANNILHLWNGTDLSVTEWTEKLDQLPTDVPVVAVMVQCFSGGFGNFVFKGGNPANGLAEHPRCGFFSTVPDRIAAGCTPNVNEAEYREYSSYFFEALCGESRIGESVVLPDYDQDGQTSFLEAHAYTVLNADTIDIPVRTADIYVRQVSNTRDGEHKLTANSPITELLSDASASERAVIEGLSQKFDLTGSDRGKDVENALRAEREEKQRIDGELRRNRQTVTTIKKEISTAVKKRWPEISSPWHPELARILAEEGEDVRQTILSHDRYAELKKENDEIKDLTDQNEQQELRIVKLERLKYWLDTVALAGNLKAHADQEKVEGLRRIVELESTFLVTKKQVAEASE
ncbi:hypothetical protein SH661x_002932 [Planctomicrobium sp. SH661]|uniref:hypothetical protein n=1 Tax=Planctomicrobium sp. SH661 TaxID=3448124 RepID=UPI003F5C1BD4